MRRSLVLAIPFLLGVPIIIGALIVAAGQPPNGGGLLAGAVGWTVALALRGPIALLAQRLIGSNVEKVQRLVVLSSGPVEEGVRLVVVLLVGRDLSTALWVGLGWAGIEVLFSIVNGFALAQLEKRTDEEAERARAMLPAQALGDAAAWWGVVERVFASALHIGFTLVVAAVPLLAAINAVTHSAVNVAFLAALRRYPIGPVMLSGLVLGAAMVIVGLTLHAAMGGQ